MKRLCRAGSSIFSALAAIALALGILASSGPASADTPPVDASYTGKCGKCPDTGDKCDPKAGATCDDTSGRPCSECDCSSRTAGGAKTCIYS